VSYFAVLLTQTAGQWSGEELSLTHIEDLDTLVETMRDRVDGGRGLFFLEEDDEYLAIVRVDGDEDARVFLSDGRVLTTSPIANLVLVEALGTETPVDDDDDDESVRPEAEPVGDTDIVDDFGISSEALLELCAEEGMLPADVMTAVAEKAGCSDIIDELRGQ
jgi:putative tRNA adenosine deaminase-associated protein